MSISSLVLELWQGIFKGLTRNLEIGNTSVWVLPNIWRLERVMDTKFSMNVSNRMLLNAAKFQGYSFYHFWVIKKKPTGWGGEVKLLPPPCTQIKVKQHIWNNSKSKNFWYYLIDAVPLLYLYQVNAKKSIKLKKVKIKGVKINIFWEIWSISMKFLGKMELMMTIKSDRKQSLAFSSHSIFFEVYSYG